MSLGLVFWLVFAATLLLILTGCPRRAAPVLIVTLLAMLISADSIG
jgi:hypothetical protein